MDCVLTAVNENKLYIDFIPIFIKTWYKLYPNVDVKIILIANKIPNNLLIYRYNIILFKPLKNISTAFISQYIRLLYPAILNYKNGIMITDIDILPMNSTYYTENIKKYSNNKFIYYRNVLLKKKQIAICYNVATNKVWSDIFNINSLNDINIRLTNVYNKINYINGHGKKGWFTDQKDLYLYIMEWNKKTNNFVFLNDKETNFNRFNRKNILLNLNLNNSTTNNIINNIKNNKYTDYHCLRPYNKYKHFNNLVFILL